MKRQGKGRILSYRLKTQLIASMMATVAFILLLLSLLFYRFTANILTKRAVENARWQITQLEYNINGLLDNLESVSRQVLVSAYFSEGINIDGLSSADSVQAINSLYALFNQLLTTHDSIESILYYGEDGKIIGATNTSNRYLDDPGKTDTFYSSNLYERARETTSAVIGGGFTYTDLFGSRPRLSDTSFISLARSVRSMGATRGYVVINVEEANLRQVYQLESMGYDGHSYLVDEDGLIVSAANKELISQPITLAVDERGTYTLAINGEEALEGGRYQYIEHRFARHALKMIYAIPDESLFVGLSTVRRVLLILFPIAMALTLVLCLAWIYKLTKPLSDLTEAMENMGKGDLGLRLDTGTRNELGTLGRQFNAMSGDIQRLLEQNRQVEEQRRQQELNALQNQLNPHFLYNTLNVIKWMAVMQNQPSITEGITSLGNMLQPIFRNRASHWPLAQETDYLKNYLHIMSLRTGSSIGLELEIPGTLEQALVLRFVLQPVVENAAVHANPQQDHPGRITIGAQQQGNDLLLTVRDNGVGIPPERLEALEALLETAGAGDTLPEEQDGEARSRGFGIGLLATHRRLRLEYGENYGLAIHSRPGEGTTVTVRMQMRGGKDREEGEAGEGLPSASPPPES